VGGGVPKGGARTRLTFDPGRSKGEGGGAARGTRSGLSAVRGRSRPRAQRRRAGHPFTLAHQVRAPPNFIQLPPFRPHQFSLIKAFAPVQLHPQSSHACPSFPTRHRHSFPPLQRPQLRLSPSTAFRPSALSSQNLLAHHQPKLGCSLSSRLPPSRLRSLLRPPTPLRSRPPPRVSRRSLVLWVCWPRQPHAAGRGPAGGGARRPEKGKSAD